MWVEGNEDAAVPLFPDPTIAELSVRYNTYLGAWMKTYTSLSVHAVCIRLSATPWGPWTAPLHMQDMFGDPPSYAHVDNRVDPPRQDWMYDGSIQVRGGGQAAMAITGWVAYSPAIIQRGRRDHHLLHDVDMEPVHRRPAQLPNSATPT